ncbi:hypothetical protein ES708_19604 [subsurface metagenome]
MTKDIPQTTPRLVLRDETRGKWLEFTSPCRIMATRRIEEVLSLVRQIEEGVRRDGLYAAGFISYEAAPAFDPSLPARIDEEFPLLWFGLFERVHEITLPPNGEESGVSIPWHPSVTSEEYLRCVRAIKNFIRADSVYMMNS